MKKKIIIIALISIFLVISILFANFIPQPRNLGGCIPEELYLEINVQNKSVSTNLTIDWQLESFYNKNVTLFGAKYWVNPQCHIIAENGTKYQYAGSITLEAIPILNMSHGEIWRGNYTIEFRNYSYHSGINYTHWQNASTGESWFFEPGNYEIFCIYESYNATVDGITTLEGIWQSNTVHFQIYSNRSEQKA